MRDLIDWAGCLAMTAITVFAVMLLAGCVTVKHWTPEQHQDMMRECRVICTKGNVKAYDPTVGECTCYQGDTDG